MRYFIGTEVTQNGDGIFICQRKFALGALKRFKMGECKPVQTPIVLGTHVDKDKDGARVDETVIKYIFGRLMYLTASRQDFMYFVCLINRYMARPIELYLQIAKKNFEVCEGYCQSCNFL